jgi:hypothetical protein
MAQLRDAQTSALIFEGTPYAVVMMADARGRENVLFDDVGVGFDPDEVLLVYEENADALKTLKRAPKKNADDIQILESTLAAQAGSDSVE